jgi:hypothetical protein
MQRFVVELSGLIDQGDFQRSWDSNCRVSPDWILDFAFVGRRISITIDSKLSNRWLSDDFYRTFSSAIRRIDRHCNIRWL